MNRLFVDTSAWDALADKGDQHHLNAIRFSDEIAGRCKLVTSNYVLDELFTLLLLNLGYSPTIAYKEKLDILMAEHVLDVIWIDEVIAMEAWEEFERYNVDKRWSFTDCTSYAVMKRLSISEVFAFDHHFEQMGFIRLPATI